MPTAEWGGLHEDKHAADNTALLGARQKRVSLVRKILEGLV